MILLMILAVVGQAVGIVDGNSRNLKYVWGNALQHDEEDLGPFGEPYPWEEVNKIIGSQRNRRSLGEQEDVLEPYEVSRLLLNAMVPKEPGADRQGRGRFQYDLRESHEGGCVPSKMCATTYNTTAPMYGISLTSGKPITIVQKFPDLLQQVVYQVCKQEECDLVHGKCVQTYLPYLFLVIPLGPVTLTGQDYVLVESGCICRPKYARQEDDPPTLPFIQAFNTSAKTSGINKSSSSRYHTFKKNSKPTKNKGKP